MLRMHHQYLSLLLLQEAEVAALCAGMQERDAALAAAALRRKEAEERLRGQVRACWLVAVHYTCGQWSEG